MVDEVTKPKRKSYLDDPTQTKRGPRKRPVPHPSVLARRSAASKKAWETSREKRMAWHKANPGATSRAGIPDGMRKADAMKAWDEARASAKETIKIMVEKKIIDGDDEKANEALETCITIMRGPSTHLPLKLTAAKTVLEWTRAKPASKQEVSIQKAEDWLAMVTADAVKSE